jgi:hypothetical protein
VGGAASALGIDIATVVNPDSIATVASAITIPFERLFIINCLTLEYINSSWKFRTISSFPDEIYTMQRSWAERAYPKLIYYNKVDKGGHFAAWEQPQLYSEEVRAGLRPLRK